MFSGERGLRQLLAMPNPPCAVFAASDHVAIGALREATIHGISMPKDIATAGFNDEPMVIHAGSAQDVNVVLASAPTQCEATERQAV